MNKIKIDNFDIVRPLLSFNNKGDFYYISLLKRRKDGTTKYSNKNNHARLVNKYMIYSLEEFDEKTKEIKAICDLLKCRAGIQINRLNDETIAKDLLRRTSEAVITQNYHINGVIESICGNRNTSQEKHVIIDIDERKDQEFLDEVTTYINSLQPFEVTNKIKAILPTYSGFHIITSNFRKDYFSNFCKGRTDISFEGTLAALYYPQQD